MLDTALHIRKMTHEDKDPVLRLGRTIFREEDEIPLLQKALRQCNLELSFVVVDAQVIAGFILVCEELTEYYFKFMRSLPSCYEIAFLGISKDYQGRGLGSTLMKEAIQSIVQRCQIYACWLLVDTINTTAIGLYERLGFQKWRKTDKGKTPVPGWIMGLRQHSYSLRSSATITAP